MLMSPQLKVGSGEVCYPYIHTMHAPESPQLPVRCYRIASSSPSHAPSFIYVFFPRQELNEILPSFYIFSVFLMYIQLFHMNVISNWTSCILDISLGFVCFAVTFCEVILLTQIKKLRHRNLEWTPLDLTVSQGKGRTWSVNSHANDLSTATLQMV